MTINNNKILQNQKKGEVGEGEIIYVWMLPCAMESKASITPSRVYSMLKATSATPRTIVLSQTTLNIGATITTLGTTTMLEVVPNTNVKPFR
jgi:hypothetical protein